MKVPSVTGKKALVVLSAGYHTCLELQGYYPQDKIGKTYQVPYVLDEETLELAYCNVRESFETRQSKTAPDEPQPARAAKS